MPAIFITDKEIKSLRRLGTALDSGMIPVIDLREMLEKLEQKITSASAPVKQGKKQNRKSKYRLAIITGKKQAS